MLLCALTIYYHQFNAKSKLIHVIVLGNYVISIKITSYFVDDYMNMDECMNMDEYTMFHRYIMQIGQAFHFNWIHWSLEWKLYANLLIFKYILPGIQLI